MKKDLRISELNDVYGALLTPRQREILQNYYDYDLSLSEIAENVGITRQGVRDTIVKASEQLSQYEEVIGVLKVKDIAKSRIGETLALLNDKDVDGATEVLRLLLREIQE